MDFLIKIWVYFSDAIAPYYSFLSIVISAITLFILILYAWTNYRLWKEAKFQSELAVSPLIFVNFNNSNKLVISNLGKGAALNIQVQPYIILLTDMHKEWRLEFDMINLLKPRAELELTYKAYENGEDINKPEAKDLIYFYVTQNSKSKPLTIEYQNCLGFKFFTNVVIEKGKAKIKGIYKKTLIRWYLYRMKNIVRDKIVRVKVGITRKRLEKD